MILQSGVGYLALIPFILSVSGIEKDHHHRHHHHFIA